MLALKLYLDSTLLESVRVVVYLELREDHKELFEQVNALSDIVTG